MVWDDKWVDQQSIRNVSPVAYVYVNIPAIDPFHVTLKQLKLEDKLK